MKHRKRAKPVDQFSPDGELINTFKSMTAAAKATGCQQSNISSCCRGKVNKAGGFIWRFSKERLTTSTNELANLYEEIKDVVEKYCILKQGYSDAITLWILGTYFLEGISAFPRLVATSPTPGCGKSQILKVIKALTHNSKTTASPTPAALYRLDKSEFPIRLIDEADEWLKQGKDATAILNMGFEKGGVVERCNENTREPEEFDVFMPLALAGIQVDSKLAPATLSRSILISVQKESGGEYADSPQMTKQYENLRNKAYAITEPLVPHYSIGQPPKHPEPRMTQVWAALFGIAQMADKLSEATQAFEVATESYEDTDVGTQLLELTRTHLNDPTLSLAKKVIKGENAEYVKTANLFGLITGDNSFSELDQNINQQQFTRMIKAFNVKQKKLKFGHSTSGVSALNVADLEKAFLVYL